ncbi:hypothetical protein [Alicyclobacillus ferrooxydans]|uniref:Uncharacterized protein n=1 Tax=Alicyclobacillus ferrooxydans TaxID=471514 RepID=A0A0P9CS91_9BACL|nr:hypothetical protein [Alicyclobacillus ferrooxydans]KPV45696.1 hypothetical protein AN477_01980 [Alicyclobacillus ferrooxydans]
MKLDTVIKLGSLAFNVAQDEKIRELWKLAHGGAKRRGLFDPPIVPLPPQNRKPYSNQSYWPRRPW